MFEFKLSEVTTSLEVFPPDRYPVTIFSDPKAYFQAGGVNPQTQENNPDREGVRFNLRIESGEHKDKPMIVSFDATNQYGAQALKGFIMAAYGYEVNNENEKKFNEDFANMSANINGATGDLGELWKNAKGKRLFATVDVGMGKAGTKGEGKPFQQFKSFEPATI